MTIIVLAGKPLIICANLVCKFIKQDACVLFGRISIFYDIAILY